MSLNRRNGVLRDLCAHVYEEDGTNPRLERKRESRTEPGVTRKDLQLCKLAGRVLSHSLRMRAGDPLLTDLDVIGVEPAPDASRLRVVCAPLWPARPERLAAAQQRLGTLRSAFRTELAAAIRRKRVPELTFVVRPPEVHEHE